MTKPIRIHAIDSEDTVRLRHEEIEKRLESIGEPIVRRMRDHGGFPPEWNVIIDAWLAGDKLEPVEVSLSPADSAALHEAIANPPDAAPALRELMASKSPWDE